MIRWLKRPATATQITHGQRLWLYALGGLVMLFLIAPTLIVIPMSFSDSQYLQFPPETWSLRWYESYFASPAWMSATATSFKAATLTCLLATPLGVAAAYGLFASQVRWAGAVYMALVTPLMVPLILFAVAAFYLLARLQMVHSLAGLVLAHSILALPLVVVVVSSALKSYDMSQEQAARSLGASRLAAFFLVTLPQIRFAVVTGALLAFLTSFDEVIVAMFVSGGENATLTRNMFNALRDQIDPTIAAISTLMIVVTTTLLALAQLFGKSER